MLTRHLYNHRLAYMLWLIFFIPAIVWATFQSSESAILFWNRLYSEPLTFFFTWSTRLGESFGFTIALLWIALSGTYRNVLGYLVATLIALILVYVFKHYVFEDAIRPIVYLERMGIELTNRTGYTLNRQYSFPSGHTTAGFTYFFFVALCRKKRWEVVLALLLCVLTAYSRVYLAQHFVIDTAAGSVLGMLIATIAYLIVVERDIWPQSFLSKSILKRGNG